MTYFDEVVASSKASFTAAGLGELFDKYLQMTTVEGLTPDQAIYRLRDDDAYKARFKANAARVAAGLSELEPAQYINMENQYKAMMKATGLPTGFYDQREDFTKWLEGDVSLQEAQQRIMKAGDVLGKADSSMKDALKNYYGIDEGQMLAYILDPERATSVINQQYDAASIGAIANRLGLGVSKSFAEQAVTSGVSDAEARNAFGQAADAQPQMDMLNSIYGDDLTGEDIAASALNLSTAGAKKAKSLASKERASFSGSSGVGAGSLGKSRGGMT